MLQLHATTHLKNYETELFAWIRMQNIYVLSRTFSCCALRPLFMAVLVCVILYAIKCDDVIQFIYLFLHGC